jgi:hypothetical protein
MLRRSVAAALLLATVLPHALAAQEASPGGQKVNVTDYRLLPSDASRFEAVTEELVNAARGINLDPKYGWFYWNDAFDYTLVYPFENMAYWDDPDQWFRQYQGTAAETKVQELFEEFATIQWEVTENAILETVPNWSYLLEDAVSNEQSAFVMANNIWIKNGSEMEWDALAQDYVALLAEIEYPYPTIGYRVLFGGGAAIRYVTLYDSKVAYYGTNSMDRLVEAKGLTETWNDILERYAMMAAKEDVVHGAAKPNMGYRIVP